MQPSDARHLADSRLNTFATRRLWPVVVGGAAVTLLFVLAMTTAAIIATRNPDTPALSIDFKVFWAAAKLLLAGEPLAVLDADRLVAIHARSPEVWMPWLYPPGYLYLIAPLGLFSFATAFTLAAALSVTLVALAVRPFVAGGTLYRISLCLAPACMPALMIGQNSLIWLAGFLAGMAALRSGRWVIAGFVIGCLTLKPQLGIMIPVALLAIGVWRTIAAATVTAVVLAAVPTLLVGLQFWDLLADNIVAINRQFAMNITEIHLMVGPASLMVNLGVPTALAQKAQLAITAASAISVFALWRSPVLSFDTKVAGLLTATLLAVPYLWYYEAAFMPIIGLFLWRAGLLIWRPSHLILLLLLWIGGGPLAIAGLLRVEEPRYLGAALITPVLVASLVLCLRALAGSRRPEPRDSVT